MISKLRICDGKLSGIFKKAAEDQELQAIFSQIKDPDEAYELAISIQPDFTKEEFIEAMTAIRDSMSEDLTDEDMAKSAGGADPEVISIAVTGATAVTAISAMAAGV